jgi:hypothetical protein
MSKALTTKQKVINEIEKYNRESKAGRLLFEEVKKSLKPFIGKPYSKRMDTALKAHFGSEFSVYIERFASLINLKLKGPWENQSEYHQQSGFSMLIGYNTTETYQEGSAEEKHSGINYFSGSYGHHSLEREKANEKVLKSNAKLEKLAKAIDLREESKKLLSGKDFESYYFPARFEIDRTFKLKEEN